MYSLESISSLLPFSVDKKSSSEEDVTVELGFQDEISDFSDLKQFEVTKRPKKKKDKKKEKKEEKDHSNHQQSPSSEPFGKYGCFFLPPWQRRLCFW